MKSTINKSIIFQVLRIIGWLLVILFVTLTKLHFESRSSSQSSWGIIVSEPLLIVHIAVSLIALFDARALHKRIRSHDNTIAERCSYVGMVSIVFAVVNGVVYATTLTSFAKYGMSLAWFVAVFAYVILPFFLKKRFSHQ